MTYRIHAVLIVDDKTYGYDKEEHDWLVNDILLTEDLILHSNEIGDEVGILKIVAVEEDNHAE